MRNAYRILVVTLGKWQFERQRRWEDDIKIDLTDCG
jgi:hypothetical protein